MLSAIAFLFTTFGRVPVVLFLKYDPKDIILVIGGFIFGPLVALLSSLVVSFVEMITISDTGLIGFMMNFIASSSFACFPALVYSKKHTLKSAVFGLILGSVVMTVSMLLWNYIVLPIFMKMPREEVLPMIFTLFLPFNIIKTGINSAFALMLYKPVVGKLRKISGFYIKSTNSEEKRTNNRAIIVISSLIVLALCISLAIYLRSKY